MAGKNRTTSDVVAFWQALAERPYAFEFFGVLRKLESLYRDRPRFGQAQHAAEDAARLGQDPHLEFAPATLSSCELGEDGERHRIGVYFLGLFGPHGPLPLHLTQFVRDRARTFGDFALSRFADVFHHRILSLFYRAWALPQPIVSYDRPDTDWFGTYVGSLFGIGIPTLRTRDAMPDVAKLHFAGLLSCQRRNPDGLTAILESFFAMPVRVVEFVGGWMTLPDPIRLRLAESETTGTLGRTAAIGGRAWGYHQRFRIAFGPMGIEDYRRLLPGGDSLSRVVAIVRNYVGYGLECDLNLVLKKEEVPALRLGKGERLGWTTWLHPRRGLADAGDLKLRIRDS